jgi:hypothetical protein
MADPVNQCPDEYDQHAVELTKNGETLVGGY